jgi:chromosome segregation ATPase
MKQYLEQTCPNCHRSLRVRTEYLGKRIVCRYCQLTFTPEAPAVPAGDAQVTALQEELQQARAERDRLARAHAEAAAAHEQTRQGHDTARAQWEAERQALLAEWDQKHQAHAAEAGRLQEELAGVRRQHEEERTALHDEAAGWREQYEALTAQIDVLTRDLERLSAQNQEMEQALRGELERLSQAVEKTGRERDELAEQADALRAEAERLEEELRQSRDELAARATEPEIIAEPEEDVSGVQEQLQSAQREAERLRAVVAELEERAGQVAEVDAELRAARTENEQLRQKVTTLPEAQAADGGEAERQRLTEQVRALEAELEKQHEAAAMALHQALETACSDASWRLSGGYAPVEEQAAPAAAQQQRWQEQVQALQQEFARERAVLQNELQRLWQENNQLRQWLGSCGVQFLQVPVPPNK